MSILSEPRFYSHYFRPLCPSDNLPGIIESSFNTHSRSRTFCRDVPAASGGIVCGWLGPCGAGGDWYRGESSGPGGWSPELFPAGTAPVQVGAKPFRAVIPSAARNLALSGSLAAPGLCSLPGGPAAISGRRSPDRSKFESNAWAAGTMVSGATATFNVLPSACALHRAVGGPPVRHDHLYRQSPCQIDQARNPPSAAQAACGQSVRGASRSGSPRIPG